MNLTTDEQLTTLVDAATTTLAGVTVEEESRGPLVALIALAILGILCAASALIFVVCRYMRVKKAEDHMKFDNPVYRKTTIPPSPRVMFAPVPTRPPAPRPYGEESLEPLTTSNHM